MRTSTVRSISAVAVAVAVVSGCSSTSGPTGGDSADESTPAPSSVQNASAETQPGGVTVDALLNAPVPALCMHEPGSLANGTLPLQDPFYGFVSIAKDSFAAVPTDDLMVALGDLTGDGQADGAFVTACTAGGVGWPATIQVYTGAGPTRLGGVDLGDVTHGREFVKSIEIADGVVKVAWMTNSETDAACCPSVPVSADLRWSGTEMVVENMVRG